MTATKPARVQLVTELRRYTCVVLVILLILICLNLKLFHKIRKPVDLVSLNSKPKYFS